MVTIGAVISAVIAISTIVGYAAGVEVTRIGSDGIEQGEDQAPILSVIAVVALMGTMAWGMWDDRAHRRDGSALLLHGQGDGADPDAAATVE